MESPSILSTLHGCCSTGARAPRSYRNQGGYDSQRFWDRPDFSHPMTPSHRRCGEPAPHGSLIPSVADFVEKHETARARRMSTGKRKRLKATGISTQRVIVATPYVFHLENGETGEPCQFFFFFLPASTGSQIESNDTVRVVAVGLK